MDSKSSRKERTVVMESLWPFLKGGGGGGGGPAGVLEGGGGGFPLLGGSDPCQGCGDAGIRAIEERLCNPNKNSRINHTINYFSRKLTHMQMDTHAGTHMHTQHSGLSLSVDC